MRAYNIVTIDFISRSANEGFARSAAVCFAAQLDPTLEEVNDLKTAVSEAVTNAIVHGYPNTFGKITLKMKLYENRVIEIQIKDRGVGIADIEQARTPLYTIGGSDRSGMGFTIMESFTDEMRVKSAPGKGTIVTLRKKIANRLGGNG